MEEAVDKDTAYRGMVAHINKKGDPYSDWYCGVTSQIDTRLHDEHKVPREKGSWWLTWRVCFNDGDARAVETALLKLGCDGGRGGGDEGCVFVYAYKKGSVTDP